MPTNTEQGELIACFLTFWCTAFKVDASCMMRCLIWMFVGTALEDLLATILRIELDYLLPLGVNAL